MNEHPASQERSNHPLVDVDRSKPPKAEHPPDAVPRDDSFRNSEPPAIAPHDHCHYCRAVVAPDAPQVKITAILQMSPTGPVLGDWWVSVCPKHWEKRQEADKEAERAARVAAVNGPSKRLIVANGPIRSV